MTSLLLGAGLLLALMLVVIWLPLRRAVPQLADAEAARAQDIAIFRERIEELDAELTAGQIDAERHALLKLELERQLLEEAGDVVAATQDRGGRDWPLALLLSVLLLPLAVVIYEALGARADLAVSMDLRRVAQSADREQQADALADLVESLARRVAADPDNHANRYLLARSYLELQRTEDALAQYRELIRRQPEPQARILAEYAQLRFFSGGRQLDAEGRELLASALQLDPDNAVALGVLGVAAYERGDYQAAIDYWQRILATAEPGPGREALQRGIASARSQLGQAPRAPAAGAQPQSSPAADVVQIPVLVEIAPGLRGELSGSEAVFVFARDPDGPPMPLAVARLRVDDLPALVRLDDTMAMTPMARLSQAERVDLQARVALSGQPQASSGDLQARPLNVAVRGQDQVLRLLIEERVR